jgi:predicted RNase H-like HicB family nuclease
MKFTVILAPEEDGGYSVICPAVPGCVSQGESLDEALANIRKAIILCLEVRREEKMPPPAESPEIVAEEIEACLKDRAEEGLPLTIETREVEIAAEVAA